MIRPPGTRLLTLARVWFDERTVALVFEPFVADWQAEYASAPASEQRRIRLRGVVTLATTAASVAARSVLREALVPPPATQTVALVGAALVSCGAAALLLNMVGVHPPPNSTRLATLALVVWAGMIWPPNRPSRQRPLATYLKMSAMLLLVVGLTDGPHAILHTAPLVAVIAGFKLPGRGSRDQLRRMGLVFGPLGILAMLNPAIDLGSWSIAWRDLLHISWGFWGVAVCSLDATRAKNDAARSALAFGRL